jgi:hypothetical protein
MEASNHASPNAEHPSGRFVPATVPCEVQICHLALCHFLDVDGGKTRAEVLAGRLVWPEITTQPLELRASNLIGDHCRK